MVEILSPLEAVPYLEQGWRAADMHVHSNRSPDVPTVPALEPNAILATAHERGMVYRTITDHDMLTYHDIKDGVLGLELTIDDPKVGHTVHFNIYDLDEKGLSALLDRRYCVDGVIGYCRREEIPFVFNHPYWFKPEDERRLRRDDASVRRAIASIKAIANDVDVIEYNAKRTKRSNDLALLLADVYDKGVIGSTDTHSGDVGLLYTIAPGERFREWWGNVADRKAHIVDTAPGSHLKIEAAHYAAHTLRQRPTNPSGWTSLVGEWFSRAVSAGQNSLSNRIATIAPTVV
jgi:predicted metal-dependent phosphoesterase TrpH